MKENLKPVEENEKNYKGRKEKSPQVRVSREITLGLK